MIAFLRVLLCALVGSISTAQATSDSWMRIRYPLADLQVDDAYCEASIIVLDAISSGPAQSASLIARVLNAPIEAAYPLGESGKLDTNAITDTAKAPLLLSVDVDEAGRTISARLAIDATALAQANGLSLEGRRDTIKRAKLALFYTLKNLFIAAPFGKVSVTITGLPDQTGVSGTKLPAKTNYVFSATAPLYLALSKDLMPTRHCPR